MAKHVLVAGTALVTSMAITGTGYAQSGPQSGAQPGAAAPATVNGQPADATGPTRAPAADSARNSAAQVAGATGDNSVQDIIVTATRRGTSLEKTPIAISAFNQAALDRQQVNNVTDLARFVPSLQFTQQGDQSAVLLTLRGIGNDTAFTEVADPEVAIYIDGVYSARAQGASVWARPEGAPGPQGTLFGRNATVGALSLVTAKPTLDKFYGNIEGVAGSYSRFGSRGAVNVPVTDNLALRFAFVTERQDGYADFQTPPNVPNINWQAFVTTGKKYYAIDQQSVPLVFERRRFQGPRFARHRAAADSAPGHQPVFDA